MSKLEELLRHPMFEQIGHDHPKNEQGSTDEEYWWCGIFHNGACEIDDRDLDSLVERALDILSGKNTGRVKYEANHD